MTYSFSDYCQFVGGRTQDRVRTLAQPLREHFSCTYFSYQRVDSRGHSQFLGDRPDWLACYVDQKFFLEGSVLRHPKFFSSGECLLSSFTPPTPLTEALREHDIGDTLLILQREEESLEVFGFAASTKETRQINTFISELPTLRLFCSYFQKHVRELVSPDECVDLTPIRGEKFLSGPNVQPTLSCIDRLRFLNQIDPRRSYLRANALSYRERTCLSLIREGLSMAKVADAIGLSPRTIEHYLESCKDKLGLFSREELVQMANLLEKVGFFEGITPMKHD